MERDVVRCRDSLEECEEQEYDEIVDAKSQARDRYAELVDQKFRSSLTESEQAELLRLQMCLDEADAKLYEPIEKKLELALTKLRQRAHVR